jgi:hypothetical protein
MMAGIYRVLDTVRLLHNYVSFQEWCKQNVAIPFWRCGNCVLELKQPAQGHCVSSQGLNPGGCGLESVKVKCEGLYEVFCG